MMATLPSPVPRALPVRAEKCAKADLRKPEMADYRALLGSAINRARLRCEWSLKEFADQVGRDERQVARWLAGIERPHWDVLFALEVFRHPLIVALAELGGDAVEIETIVRLRYPKAGLR